MLRLTYVHGTIAFDNPELEERLMRHQQEVDAKAEAWARAETRQLNTVYRISGGYNPKQDFGGLLTERLQLSERSIRDLITSGQLAYFCGAKKAYRVTEPDVRDYLERVRVRAAA